MEKKWTPGPWSCSTQSKLLRVGKVIPGGGVVICGIHRFGARGGAKCSGDPISNAHLIAAAPELYDALEAAEESIATFIGVHDYPENSGAQDILNQIRSALTKARGETQ